VTIETSKNFVYSLQPFLRDLRRKRLDMSKATKTLKQMKKATGLVNRTFHKHGPKSYKNGQGALLKVLHRNDGQATSPELVDKLGFDRKFLKAVVNKAENNGFVTIENTEEKRVYIVRLTAEGEKVAEKRCAKHTATAEKILDCLTDEEIETLNKLTEKIIVSCKENGAHGKRKSGKKFRRGERKHEKRCCQRHHGRH
jgi:DNA-binding MarR family transcriptional regulator